MTHHLTFDIEDFFEPEELSDPNDWDRYERQVVVNTERILALDPSLRAQDFAGAVLFVTLREGGFGAGPPLAARKIAVAAFPMRFEIGSADSMTGEELPDDRYLRTLDPWVSLATCAAVTSTIGLSTAVALPVESDPITLAKTLATLDHLSGGRVTLGAGFGWNTDELADHGVPGARRRTALKEYVGAMRALWTQEEASFQGEFVSFGPSWAWPKPVQAHVPLVIGAGGAGLRAAIAAHDAGAKVAVLCKSLLGKAHTVMAEGGIAAALGTVYEQDNWQVHFRDTMRGGKMLNSWRMAQLHAQESPDRVYELEDWGALFDRTADGRILQRDFGGHRYARLAHVGDRTGLEMIRTLQYHGIHQGIDVYMECKVERLLRDGDRIAGAVGYWRNTGQFVVFKAKAVVLATGGIGGVHRGALGSVDATPPSFDISSDLEELAVTPMAVVCAGPKAILDVPATLEYLETMSVPVVGYGVDEFPAFYSRESGLDVSLNLETPEEIVEFARAHWSTGLQSAILVANPVPLANAISRSEMEPHIRRANQEAHDKGIHGKALTPFLLGRLSELSGGKSMQANLSLLLNNARLASQIAKAFRAVERRKAV